MKNLIYATVILLCGTAIAQEKPKEVKEEVKIKTIKYKDANGVKEKKIKMVKREEGSVKLKAGDSTKVNQSRIPSSTKVEETLLVNSNGDDTFKILDTETYFMSSNGAYRFTPSKSGFSIISKQNDDNAAEAWETSNGYYLIRGEDINNGIGHFENDGSFVVEYYCSDSDCVKKITYNRDQDDS